METDALALDNGHAFEQVHMQFAIGHCFSIIQFSTKVRTTEPQFANN